MQVSNTGVLDGGNMYGSRHTYNKVKQNHSVYKWAVEWRLSHNVYFKGSFTLLIFYVLSCDWLLASMF